MNNSLKYVVDAGNFYKIPEHPIAYWCSANMFDIFANEKSLEHIAHPKKGLATTDNNRFLRMWFEIENTKFGIGYKNASSAQASHSKWFPLNKGGEYRKWYGNSTYVVNWENNGAEMKDAIIKRYNGGSYTKEIRSESYYFQNSITWSALTAGAPSFRFSNYGALFDSAGSSMFPDENVEYLMGFLNTKIVEIILAIINPTLNYGAGTIGCVPLIVEKNIKTDVESKAKENISLAKEYWDSFETSWYFKKHPLI